MKKVKALKACLKWLSYCLEIGWDINDIDGLEKLWWKYHDDNGILII
jgi:hypothetical protein